MSPLSKQTEDKTVNEVSPFILWDLLTLDPPPNTVLMSKRHKMNEAHMQNNKTATVSTIPNIPRNCMDMDNFQITKILRFTLIQ